VSDKEYGLKIALYMRNFVEKSKKKWAYFDKNLRFSFHV
jgi:hypothetical protein